MACKAQEIIAIVEELAPPHLAEGWDNVGLQVGSAHAVVDAVLVSLDADLEVIAEARERGAGLVVCHHPPIFRPLRRVVTDEAAGALVREALVAGVAVYAAHTNLDASPHGVNVALAELLGLREHAPLLSAPAGESYKLVTYLPPAHVAEVSAALFRAGAGVIGGYTGCSFRSEGTGTFTAGSHTRPAYGGRGENEVAEVRLETVVAGAKLEGALEALLAAHPYEEPAYDVYRRHNPSGAGLGRVGDLPAPVSLEEFARACAQALGNPGVRLAGDARAMVSRVAVCGGSGAGLAARALECGAQALVTGDVGFHQAREAAAAGLAVIDGGHYHTERPVVRHLASLLAGRAREWDLQVEVIASQAHTDPWSDGGAA